MKKGVLLAALAALLMLAAPAAAGTMLTYSNFFPPTHIQSKLAHEWAKEVEKRSGGEVMVQYFPGGTLTKARQAYDGVVQGISDIGMSALAYSRGRFPVMAAVDLPLGYTSGVGATSVANEVYRHFKPEELSDVKVLYFHAHGPGILFTKGKKVEKLEDLQGLKVRATGNSAKLAAALGATPVAQSMPDAYQSLRKGVVDGGFYPMETNKGWKMAEVVDYCTESYPAAYTTTFFVVMNKAKWDALSDNAKKVLEEVSAEWSVKHGEAWDSSDEEGREYFVEKGGSFIPLSKAEGKRWQDAARPVIDQYIEETTAKGLDGKAIVDFTERSLKSAQ
ncbi:TRAP transporter substrate-binding protein [Salidesulfovibrio brasiliensis]|uniref:TRAP transporter substrate-binding protein n=1 Tax=Salidesulfovibrio brasiliensis TaxID=221711 RepID=UPI0006D1FA18|nr:TRAP transporter substrate-binding protein [Salidesulfovibrio brasiliensis]